MFYLPLALMASIPESDVLGAFALIIDLTGVCVCARARVYVYVRVLARFNAF